MLDAPSYKWIFVGGKGGVGKTTTACAIATVLAKRRGRVLLVSTDPASNLDDTFQQHFSSEPTLINGFTNLWAMNGREGSEESESQPGGLGSLMNMPGVDELMILSSLFASVERDEYDVVVFDTAPTGHTVRLLQLPKNCEKLFGTLGAMRGFITNTLSQVSGSDGDIAMRQMARVQELAPKTSQRLMNSMECTFVCVTLPKFSPLWETERLVKFLTEQDIESHTLIVNQVMRKPETGCTKCNATYESQQKTLKDIYEAYDDYRILEVPELDNEVKGLESVQSFAELLLPLFSSQ